MKTDNKSNGIRSLLLISSLFGVIHFAQADNTMTDNKTVISGNKAMTIPNTPQELWSRIMTLLQINQGFVTKNEVENTLGMRFTHTEKDEENRNLYIHGLNQNMEGLGQVRMSLHENGLGMRSSSLLAIDWGPERADVTNCLQLQQVTHDLNALGWPLSPAPGPCGRCALNGIRNEDLEHAKKFGKFDRFSLSTIDVLLPSQGSYCVNGVRAHIFT